MSKEASTVEKVAYRRKDAAHALSTSTKTIDRLIAKKIIRAVRGGGATLIPASEVKRLGRCGW